MKARLAVLISVFLLATSLTVVFRLASKESSSATSKSRTYNDGRVNFYWTTMSEDNRIAGIYVETRKVLQRQFHNNITGEAGEFCNVDEMIPGPSPLADRLALQEGVVGVTFSKHTMHVEYTKDFLTFKNISSEIGKLEVFITNNLEPLAEFHYDPLNTYDPHECDVFAGCYSCFIDTLYITKRDLTDNKDKILLLAGIESIDDYEDSRCAGCWRIHKSHLFSWQELKPKIYSLVTK